MSLSDDAMILIDLVSSFIMKEKESEQLHLFYEMLQGIHINMLQHEAYYSNPWCDRGWDIEPKKPRWTSRKSSGSPSTSQDLHELFSETSSSSGATTSSKPAESWWPSPSTLRRPHQPSISPDVYQPTFSSFTPGKPWVKTAATHRPPTIVGCTFCKNNKEPEKVWNGHILKDPHGKVLCPRLRAYNCPLCNNGGGDFAHTKTHCSLYPRRR